MSTVLQTNIATKLETYVRPEPPDRAMACRVARDMLNELNSYNFNHGSYLHISRRNPEEIVQNFVKDVRQRSGCDLQQYAESIRPHCQVCFLGGLLLAKAKVCNSVALSGAESPDEHYDSVSVDFCSEFVYGGLSDVFDEATLRLAEIAFELSPNFFTAYFIPPELKYGALVFGFKAGRRMERVKAVLENILENAGQFIVSPMSLQEYENQFPSGVVMTADDEDFEDDEDDSDLDDEDDDFDDFDDEDDDFDDFDDEDDDFDDDLDDEDEDEDEDE